MKHYQRLLGAFLFITTLASPALAGPSKESLLGYLEEQIARDPESTTPYLRRAHTLAEIGMWEIAYADLDQLDRLGDHATAALVRGDFLSRQGKWIKARIELDKAVRLQPHNLRAYLLRADVHIAQGNKKKALADYHQVFNLQPEIESGFYRQAAKLTEELEGASAALVLLDRRIQAVGPIPQLQNLAISIERKRKNYTAAIARLKTFGSLMQSSPFWHSEVANLHLLNGNRSNAQQHLDIAQDLLGGRRQTQVSQQLQGDLVALRQKLGAD